MSSNTEFGISTVFGLTGCLVQCPFAFVSKMLSHVDLWYSLNKSIWWSCPDTWEYPRVAALNHVTCDKGTQSILRCTPDLSADLKANNKYVCEQLQIITTRCGAVLGKQTILKSDHFPGIDLAKVLSIAARLKFFGRVCCSLDYLRWFQLFSPRWKNKIRFFLSAFDSCQDVRTWSSDRS